MTFNFKDFITFHLVQRFHIKDLLNYVQGHMLITHIRTISFSKQSQEFIFTFYMYQVRDTSLTKQDTHTYFTISYITYHSRGT